MKKRKAKRKPARKPSQSRPNFPPRLDIAHDCKVGKFDIPTEAVFTQSRVYPHVVWS